MDYKDFLVKRSIAKLFMNLKKKKFSQNFLIIFETEAKYIPKFKRLCIKLR